MKNKKNTLLFVAPSAYPLGGVATWLDYILPGLENKGWEVFLGLTGGKFHDIDEYIKIHPYDNVIRIINQSGSHEGRVRSVYKLIKKINPDILVVNAIPDAFYAIERIRFVDKDYEIKVVMTFHNMWPAFYDDLKSHMDTIDAVIGTNSLACKLASFDAGFSNERIYYAPYGVDIIERKTTNATGRMKIVYAGRIEDPQKRVLDIPEIINHLCMLDVDFEFLIAGSGPSHSELKKLLSEYGHSGRVSFFGDLPQETLVKKVYSQSDIMLITSFWETGPIVLWEAMSQGIAVVSSSYTGSGLEGTLKDGKNCLLFPVGDIKKASKCIGSLQDHLLREKIVSNGYKTVQNYYNHTRSIDLWHQSLSAIMNQPALKRKNNITKVKSSGRLDNFFGNYFAEYVRELLSKEFVHSCPGSEWPHSYGKRSPHDSLFWEKAVCLDESKK